MKVLQVSNIVSHHQLPLARELMQRTGSDNFRFAVTQPPSAERLRLGWGDDREPWILRIAEDERERDAFEEWWGKADLVLCGERLLQHFRRRLDKGKLTFYMSERWWKPPIGRARLLHPGFAKMAWEFHRLALSPFFQFLSVGGYAAQDMWTVAPFPGRTWEWGYFTYPSAREVSDAERGVGFRVLWAGRMLGWKRVDTLIKGFSLVRESDPAAELTLIGEGPELQSLTGLAKRWLPAGSYRFLPAQPVDAVRQIMRRHHVYVLPSNGCEGWGAVLNEAMSEGCAIVASQSAGAARTMIDHGRNGLLFPAGNWKALGGHLRNLAANAALLRDLALEGERTILDRWSPAVGAERLLAVGRALLGRSTPPLYDGGPMSPRLPAARRSA